MLACVLALSACGGGGGAAPADDAPRYRSAWDFSSAAGWTLVAEPPGQARAVIDAGALALEARVHLDPATDEWQCALAAASADFGDAQTRADADSALDLTLSVSRWDLGLGPFDTHLPVLEVVHHGLRTDLPVGGFTSMPGTMVLSWRRGAGWAMTLGTVTTPMTPPARSDAGPPSLRLWTDGCSEGLSQSLQVDAIEVSAR